ncbi:MAG: helix-turn-helix domain-containing protein [Lachnospiraceae bacterium]|nr:helix-turn-helix domain-containing protein [Lachnospiraceae bacterium]
MELPVIDPVATGRRINELRTANHLSVADIKEYLGFATTNAVYKWLKGESMPTVDNLLALSLLFRVSMNEMIVYH